MVKKQLFESISSSTSQYCTAIQKMLYVLNFPKIIQEKHASCACLVEPSIQFYHLIQLLEKPTFGMKFR